MAPSSTASAPSSSAASAAEAAGAGSGGVEAAIGDAAGEPPEEPLTRSETAAKDANDASHGDRGLVTVKQVVVVNKQQPTSALSIKLQQQRDSTNDLRGKDVPSASACVAASDAASPSSSSSSSSSQASQLATTPPTSAQATSTCSCCSSQRPHAQRCESPGAIPFPPSPSPSVRTDDSAAAAGSYTAPGSPSSISSWNSYASSALGGGGIVAARRLGDLADVEDDEGAASDVGSVQDHSAAVGGSETGQGAADGNSSSASGTSAGSNANANPNVGHYTSGQHLAPSGVLHHHHAHSHGHGHGHGHHSHHSHHHDSQSIHEPELETVSELEEEGDGLQDHGDGDVDQSEAESLATTADEHDDAEDTPAPAHGSPSTDFHGGTAATPQTGAAIKGGRYDHHYHQPQWQHNASGPRRRWAAHGKHYPQRHPHPHLHSLSLEASSGAGKAATNAPSHTHFSTRGLGHIYAQNGTRWGGNRGSSGNAGGSASSSAAAAAASTSAPTPTPTRATQVRRRKGRIAEIVHEDFGPHSDTTSSPSSSTQSSGANSPASGDGEHATPLSTWVPLSIVSPIASSTACSGGSGNDSVGPDVLIAPPAPVPPFSVDDYSFVGPPPLPPPRSISPSETIPVIPSRLCECVSADEDPGDVAVQDDCGRRASEQDGCHNDTPMPDAGADAGDSKPARAVSTSSASTCSSVSTFCSTSRLSITTTEDGADTDATAPSTPPSSPPPSPLTRSGTIRASAPHLKRSALTPAPFSSAGSGSSSSSSMSKAQSASATMPAPSASVTPTGDRTRRASTSATLKKPLRPCFRRRATAQGSLASNHDSSSERESPPYSSSRAAFRHAHVRFSQAPPQEVRTHSPVEYDRKSCSISNRLSAEDVEELRMMKMELGLLEAKWAAMAAWKEERSLGPHDEKVEISFGHTPNHTAINERGKTGKDFQSRCLERFGAMPLLSGSGSELPPFTTSHSPVSSPSHMTAGMQNPFSRPLTPKHGPSGSPASVHNDELHKETERLAERAMLSSEHCPAKIGRRAHAERVCLMSRFGLLDAPPPPLPGTASKSGYMSSSSVPMFGGTADQYRGHQRLLYANAYPNTPNVNTPIITSCLSSSVLPRLNSGSVAGRSSSAPPRGRSEVVEQACLTVPAESSLSTRTESESPVDIAQTDGEATTPTARGRSSTVDATKTMSTPSGAAQGHDSMLPTDSLATPTAASLSASADGVDSIPALVHTSPSPPRPPSPCRVLDAQHAASSASSSSARPSASRQPASLQTYSAPLSSGSLLAAQAPSSSYKPASLPFSAPPHAKQFTGSSSSSLSKRRDPPLRSPHDASPTSSLLHGARPGSASDSASSKAAAEECYFSAGAVSTKASSFAVSTSVAAKKQTPYCFSPRAAIDTARSYQFASSSSPRSGPMHATLSAVSTGYDSPVSEFYESGSEYDLLG
ncbi:hypothetical protein K437DRAFT_268216 [Tilletiaria anomala UBC 951]|uniref:Uncharacterized protein n=1 Tax=Tilletiaria anomala (strain ATCC 24038 / CBS 436.72 / UBC 951) TaxID=1037660 RepID=A0A066W4X5_TILAU|nr:uncharacterized protein K437DRAFT_268216 [Tilletiaria anomala UBC 951]KDN46134.1 hypothetical protein K437DRAFT_268216 [Tilletiaria anomala UBC 951]